MFLPQEEPTPGQRFRKSLQNLGESIQSLLGSKENLTFTWAESVRFIIEDLSSTDASPTSPGSPVRVERISEQEREKVEDDVLRLEGKLTKLRAVLRDEDGRRREALNKYLDLKGNIRVFCRIRPLLANEQHARLGPVVNPGSEEVLISTPGKRKDFQLDGIFLPFSSQDDVFSEVEPVLRSALDGHNVCIFAYGQTGTGKTFTMEGTVDSPGVMPRTLQQLFYQASLDNTSTFHFTFSMLEVYMGCLRDLLVPPPRRFTDPPPKCLSIQMDAKGRVEVENLTEFIITDSNQAEQLYWIGNHSRSTACTNANEASSRSHCLLRITIACTGTHNRRRDVSKLWLVDLGGSERLLKTQAKGQILEEGKAINLSLSALGDVISALQRKQPHVPYRNSKLTQILRDSLGEDCKTLMLVHVSPKEDDIGETTCSLAFATRARGIHLGRELSDRAKEERAKAMEKVLQQTKVHENTCQNLRGNIQELEYLIRKKKGILESGNQRCECPNEQVSSPVKPMISYKTGSERKGNAADWSACVPRFMTPTACSRLKKRLDLNHINSLGGGRGDKKVQGHRRRPSLGFRMRDAKVAPMESTLQSEQVAEAKHNIKTSGFKAGEKTAIHPMQQKRSNPPPLVSYKLNHESENHWKDQGQAHLQAPRSARKEKQAFNGQCKNSSLKSNRRRVTLECSGRFSFNRRF